MEIAHPGAELVRRLSGSQHMSCVDDAKVSQKQGTPKHPAKAGCGDEHHDGRRLAEGESDLRQADRGQVTLVQGRAG